MKTVLFLIILTLTPLTMNAQEITGRWNGLLSVQGTQLRVIFNVSETDSGYTSTLDSPDQGAFGIPVTSTTFENPEVTFRIQDLGVEYTGELKEGQVVGTFKQGGQNFPITLTRDTPEKADVRRPQDPVKPYPYYSEDVTFKNVQANISLAGTLTLPEKEGRFPVAILISGSGPQNRDEELLGHKPFLVISDHLTRNGIGVLRYDDRGVGKSEGDHDAATSEDFTTDAESAIAYLKTRNDVNSDMIGLIGHSEGGLIAPIVASRSDDVSFIVLLAGTGIRGDKIILLQQELIARAGGTPESEIETMKRINSEFIEMVVKSDDDQKLKTDLTNFLLETLEKEPDAEIPEGMTKEAYVGMQVKAFSGPWMKYFLKFDPATTLEKVKCPVLAINGEKDLQVPPKENLEAIRQALAKGGNENVTIAELPNLNHLFQECKTGSPDEYAAIEQTFAPTALKLVSDWIKTQTK